MKLLLENCSEKIQNIAVELKQELQIHEGDEAVVLWTEEREAAGFSLDVKDGKAKLSYGSLAALCRGLLTLYSAKETTFCCEETPSCKDLGYMVDCSRNAVIRLPQLKKMIRV